MWKDVILKDGTLLPYEVNEKGKIRNNKPNDSNYHKILKGGTDFSGYMRVTLRDKSIGFKKIIKVHVIVALAFIENDDPINKTQINHIDGIKTNNNASNLEWCTPKENIVHAHTHGLWHPCIGEDNGTNKYSEEQIRRVCELLEKNVPPASIERLTGVNRAVVNGIISGRSWTHISKDYIISNYKKRKRHELACGMIYIWLIENRSKKYMETNLIYLGEDLKTARKLIYQRTKFFNERIKPNLVKESSTTIPKGSRAQKTEFEMENSQK